MIEIEVQFEQHGELHCFSSPLIVEHGDRVVVPRHDTLAVAIVVGVGSTMEPEDEVIRVLGPLEHEDEA